jgi:hypothetical protein
MFTTFDRAQSIPFLCLLLCERANKRIEHSTEKISNTANVTLMYGTNSLQI